MLFTYYIENQMSFFPFAQNHTPILVSQDTMFLWTFWPCFHILHSYSKVEAHAQSSKLATTKLKGFVPGGGRHSRGGRIIYPLHLYIQISKDSKIDGPCVNTSNKVCKMMQRRFANHVNPCKTI
jgi:hypothetical protein